MIPFTYLINQLFHSNTTLAKVDALEQYFRSDVSAADCDEAFNLLLGNTPKRVVSSRQLKTWVTTIIGLPNWLIERSEKETKSFLEALSLLLGAQSKTRKEDSISNWLARIMALSQCPSEKIQDFVGNELSKVDPDQRLILLKIMTGNFRSPVTQHEIALCLSRILNEQKEIVSLRLFKALKREKFVYNNMKQEILDEKNKIPLDFPTIETFTKDGIAIRYKQGLRAFGKRDGILAHLIKYRDELHLWTINGDLITDKYPEITSQIHYLVSNFGAIGQIVANSKDITPNDAIDRFKQKQISNTNDTIGNFAFEIWEVYSGNLTSNATPNGIIYPEEFSISSREDLDKLHKKCRKMGFSGIVMQQLPGKKLYLWKAEPLSICAVLMHIELGNFNKSGIQSMTFGVQHQGEIVPIVKIEEIEEHIDAEHILTFAKSNTTDRFGPVRSLNFQLVYRLSFDDLVVSSRRKSGLVLVSPSLISFVGKDLTAVDDLAILKKMI